MSRVNGLPATDTLEELDLYEVPTFALTDALDGLDESHDPADILDVHLEELA